MNLILGIIIGSLILIFVVLAVIYFSVKIKKNNGGESAKSSSEYAALKRKGLSDGVQIALTGLMVGLLLVLAFRENFFDIFGKETPSWLKLAVIFIIIRSVWFFIAPLGQKPTFEPIRNATNFLYVVAFLIVIPAMIFGWDGNFGSLKFWGEQQSKQVVSAQPPKLIYQKKLILNGQWQELETVPQMCFRYRFELPDSTTEIQVMYKRHHKTKQILNILGEFCSAYVDAPNPGDIPLLARIISGEKKEVLLTVTK